MNKNSPASLTSGKRASRLLCSAFAKGIPHTMIIAIVAHLPLLVSADSSHHPARFNTATRVAVMAALPPPLPPSCASPGKDGVGTLGSAVINTYYAGGSASGTSVTLGAIRDSSKPAIAVGDLILIIQMQDGTSVNFSNTSAYGSGVSATVGRYEYATVKTVSGANLTLSVALTYGYTQNVSSRQTFQVIRIPQYSSASITGTVTSDPWNGTTGGIVAFDVTGTLAFSGGNINVTGHGFRGGAGLQKTGDTTPTTYGKTDFRYASTVQFSGMKGEGTAGTPLTVASPDGTSNLAGADNYTNGSIGRGAPGNAGGGSDDYAPDVDNGLNAGGGGGGNAGAGGQGGNNWHNNLTVNNNPTGFVQGGLGGAAIVPSTTQIVLGGGGGAGDGNNSTSANQYKMSGAHGGGIVLVRAGNFSGSGTITANGNSALDLPNDSSTQTDAGGGGGAGGSVVVSVVNGTGSGLTINARGGKGGNSGYREHGPGGGGGGGFIAAPAGASMNVNKGLSGRDVLNAQYNATDGADGLTTTSGTPTGTGSGGDCLPNLTVTKSVASTGASTAPTTATYTITAQNATGAGTAQQVRISDLRLPAGFTFASAGAFTVSSGVYLAGTTIPATLAGLTTKPSSGNRALNWANLDIPEGGSVSITFTVNIAAGTADGTYHNPASVAYLDPTRSTTTRVVQPATNATNSTANGGTAFTNNTTYQTGGFTNVIGSNYDGTAAGPSNENVVISSVPSLTLVKSCPAPVDCLTASQNPGTELTYEIIFTNEGGVAAQQLILVDEIPSHTDFKIGSQTTNSGTTGLTIVTEFSNNYSAASPSTATWTYTPSSGGGGASSGYDRNVRAIRWRVTTGILSNSSPNNTGTVRFAAVIR